MTPRALTADEWTVLEAIAARGPLTRAGVLALRVAAHDAVVLALKEAGLVRTQAIRHSVTRQWSTWHDVTAAGQALLNGRARRSA